MIGVVIYLAMVALTIRVRLVVPVADDGCGWAVAKPSSWEAAFTEGLVVVCMDTHCGTKHMHVFVAWLGLVPQQVGGLVVTRGTDTAADVGCHL